MPSPVGFVSLNPRLFIDFSCGKVRGMRLTRPSGRPYSYALRLKSESSPPKKFKKILQIPKISLPLHRKSKRADSVAQLVEQMTLNHWVESSSLSGVTKPTGKIKQIAETKTVSAIFVISLSGRIKHIVVSLQTGYGLTNFYGLKSLLPTSTSFFRKNAIYPRLHELSYP